MSIIDNIIERWVDLIDGPYVVNEKQGFILKNGIRILLKDSYLSDKSREILKRHYEKKRGK